MRVFRRRKRDDEEDIIEGEIEEIDDSEEDSDEHLDDTPPPLERVAPDIPTPEETALTQYRRPPTAPPSPTPQRQRPRFRLPNLLAWDEINPPMLLVAVGLVAGGIFWTLYNLGQTSDQAENWWPLVLLGLALGWAVYNLLVRRPTAFLAASALVGLSLSLLLDAQNLIDWQQTLIASMVMGVGIGLVARGLLLRQGTVAS